MKRLGQLSIIMVLLLLAGCELVVDNHPPRHRCPDGRCPNGICPDGHCPRQADGTPDWRLAGDNVPAMSLPLSLRMHNYGGGSCVFASWENCLREQHQYQWADYYRSHYSGGESLGGLVDTAEKFGLRYAFTDRGDVDFLAWATRTKRGAAIFYFPDHCINFCGVHLDASGAAQAWLLDNNREQTYLTVPWDEFVSNWRGFGGVAITPIYVPPPPRPIARTSYAQAN